MQFQACTRSGHAIRPWRLARLSRLALLIVLPGVVGATFLLPLGPSAFEKVEPSPVIGFCTDFCAAAVHLVFFQTRILSLLNSLSAPAPLLLLLCGMLSR